ncbi:hypothetical protein F4801DRAFT_73038 [Xylaria longipes]|nr:hypothetical protein F4801DRAFT_73038 [Xylaria longipes]
MSGIEAVGLVMTIIPFVVSALEQYQDGESAVSTWRQHKRVVQSLTRNLKTEHGKLYNTCETLLGGIVSPDKLELMLKEPFGPLWQREKTKERIERRLDHMYNTFQETVGDMLATMKELRSNLGLNDQGQSEWYTGGTVKRNIMRASLVIKRSSYDRALRELISQNQTLENIVVSSLRLEPSRGKRSRGKYLRAVKKDCQQYIQALTTRDEEAIIEKLHFGVILSHYAVGLSTLQSRSRNRKEVKLQVDIPSEVPRGGLASLVVLMGEG